MSVDTPSIEVQDRRDRRTRSAKVNSISPADVNPLPVLAPLANHPVHWIRKINWPAAFWLVAVHIGALAAPLTFSWPGLIAMLVLGWLTGGVGICMGYHRLFTHRSFVAVRPLRWLIALFGTLAGQGPLIDWVADHRKHHAHSDREGDPHSPNDGPWWSHMLWMMSARNRSQKGHRQHWAPDLLKEPVLVWLDRLFLPLHLAFGVMVFGLGFWIGGLAGACSLLVWGVFLRLVNVFHVTWAVNSASHMWGYRNYETTDNSRNLWWVALLSYGEGWHNNHHAFPRMARNRHRWWEFDPTFELIRLLGALRLAKDIVADQDKRPRAGREGSGGSHVMHESPSGGRDSSAIGVPQA